MENVTDSRSVVGRRAFLKSSAAAVLSSTALSAFAHNSKKAPIVDTHMHIWAKDLKKYPFGPGIKPPKIAGTVELLVEEMDQFHIDYCVLVQVIYHRWDNRYVADCIKKYPRRFRAHGLIDPEDPGVANKLEYWVTNQGLAGMRFSPIYYRGKDDWLNARSHDTLWDKAAELGAIFNFFIATEQLPKLEDMIRRHPDVPVVIDHLARVDLKGTDPTTEFKKLLSLAKYPQVFCKVSELSITSPSEKSPYKDTWPWVKQMYESFGPDRLLWGTGFPGATRAQAGRPSLEEELALIRTEIPFFNNADRKKILGLNAAKLWKFGSA